MEKYSDTVSRATVGFLSVWGETSKKAMEAIECMADQDASLHALAWDNFYKTGSYTSDELEAFAAENGINIDDYQACISSEDIAQKVTTEAGYGRDFFGISGTPGNIIINLETREYASAAWSIEETIAKLLGE